MIPIRQQLVAEARTWLRTPFHHRARVKGAGIDCVNLLIAVYQSAGIVDDIDPGEYTRDWHMHHDEPRFLDRLRDHADQLDDPSCALPGDIAMFTYGRHASHGAIITTWPTIIHADSHLGQVIETDILRSPLARRLHGVWRVKGL